MANNSRCAGKTRIFIAGVLNLYARIRDVSETALSPGSGPKKKGGFEQPGFFAAAAAGEQLCAQYRLVTEDDYG